MNQSPLFATFTYLPSTLARPAAPTVQSASFQVAENEEVLQRQQTVAAVGVTTQTHFSHICPL